MFSWQKYKEEKLRSLKKAMEKGEVDKGIIPIIEEINSFSFLVTTSSCYGRIVLLKNQGDKKRAHFLFKEHRKVKLKEILSIISKNKEKDLWFRMEPFILHVAAKDIVEGKKFLRIIRTLGIKRAGIQEINNKVIMEIIGTNSIYVPTDAVGDWAYLIKKANEYFEKNEERIKDILKGLKKWKEYI